MNQGLFDAQMVRDLARAAELLEKKEGGRIWDDASREALEYARRIGLRSRNASADAVSADTEPKPSPRKNDVRDSLITAALAALRGHEYPTAVNLLGAYIDLKAEGVL